MTGGDQILASAVPPQAPGSIDPAAPEIVPAIKMPVELGVKQPEERFSPKFEALARKEAQAVRKLQEAQTLRQQVEAKEELLKAREAKLTEFEALKDNPLKALEYLGTDYNQLTQTYLNQGEPTADQKVKKLEQELIEMRRSLGEKETKNQEVQRHAAEQQVEENVKAFKGKIVTHLGASDSYPLTNLYKRDDLVYSTIEAHYDATFKKTGMGEIMDIGKAAELTEAYLTKEAQKAQELLAKKNPGAASIPSGPRQRLSAPVETQWVEKPIKTLSDSRITPTVSAISTHFLSDEERVERAVAKLRGRQR